MIWFKFNKFVLRLVAAWRVYRNLGMAEVVAIAAFRALFNYAAPLWRSRAKRALERSLRYSKVQTMIMVGTVDWAYPYQQRPHHLARALVRLGWRILYVSPGHGRDRVFITAEAHPGVLLTLHLREALAAIPNPLVYVCSTDVRSLPFVVAELDERGGHIVYDYLDHLDSSISNSALTCSFRKAHNRVLRDETLAFVLASANVLHGEVSQVRQNKHALVTNAVDVQHFTVAREPGRLSRSARETVGLGSPIIGFFGVLASWVNIELVAAVARRRPEYQFVLMGPVLRNAPPVMSQLPHNVHVWPPISYDELPAQAVFFDVLIIPFLLNAVTAATSPLKLFEYMALGKPIVSTPIQESLKYDVVLVAEEEAGFAEALDQALVLRGDESYVQRLAELAKENSWDKKALLVQALLRENSTLLQHHY